MSHEKTWIYARNNAYDLIIKVDGCVSHYLAQTDEFPKCDEDIGDFMCSVMENDCSGEWDCLPTDEILDGANILWERNNITY